MENDRIYAVASKLTDYFKSPSLRHIRDPQSLDIMIPSVYGARHLYY
jgi:hypothetical protein